MSPDWERVTDATVQQLRRLIRFRTVNPPGNERGIAEYLEDALRDGAIDTELIETAPGRAAVAGRIRGDGSAPAVLLVAHTDVVVADPAAWSVDPFGGEIRDGYVYGRGAIDDKGMLAANLVAMLLLRSALDAGDIVLSRDVVFLATPDEETGGERGISWLADNRPDLFRAEYALNEGGRVRIAPDGTRTVLIQTAEKTSHIVTLTAHGAAGHASVPRADNCVLRLGRALAAISTYAADPANGVSPTIVRGGEKVNVIPGEACATLNVRTSPAQSLDLVAHDLTTLIADPDVTVAVTLRGEASPASPEDSVMFRAIARAALELDPGAAVQPYLSAGGTDSAKLRRLGIEAYGILPFPLTIDDERRMHGVDERVSVESLGFGTRLVFGTMCGIARTEPLNS